MALESSPCNCHVVLLLSENFMGLHLVRGLQTAQSQRGGPYVISQIGKILSCEASRQQKLDCDVHKTVGIRVRSFSHKATGTEEVRRAGLLHESK